MAAPDFVVKWTSWGPYLQSLLRIVAAFIFVLAGSIILFGFPMAMPGGAQIPAFSQLWIGGVLELVGGVLLLLGLFTRPTAFVLSGMMAVAYFQFHFPHGFWPNGNQGIPAVLYCFLWLYFSAAGPGPWSLDEQRGK
jgi:putative oxidoreductase